MKFCWQRCSAEPLLILNAFSNWYVTSDAPVCSEGVVEHLLVVVNKTLKLLDELFFHPECPDGRNSGQGFAEKRKNRRLPVRLQPLQLPRDARKNPRSRFLQFLASRASAMVTPVLIWSLRSSSFESWQCLEEDFLAAPCNSCMNMFLKLLGSKWIASNLATHWAGGYTLQLYVSGRASQRITANTFSKLTVK